ncbi:MAG: OmpA family protein [Adhaeribacter sp.]
MGVLLVLVLAGGPVCAQSDLRKANEYFQAHEFAKAIAAYQQVLQSRPPTLALARNLAQAYRLNNNSREAETWFAKVLSFPGHEPIHLYHYAEALKSNGKYAEARVQYQAYAARVPAEAAMIEKRLQAIDLAQSWLAQPAPVEVLPVEKLNSSYADFSPVPFEQGLLFASDRPLRGDAPLAGWTGRPYLRLFYAKKEGGAWGQPVPLEPVLNTATHNGPATAGSDSKVVYFTRTFLRRDQQQAANTDPTSWEAGTGPAQNLVNRLAIYSAEKRNGKWINIRPFAYNKVASYSVGHPALSPDGKYLYFVSDMPGGKGQTDIYYCERRTGGSWSRPVNAGPVINTSGRESFPVVGADGTLYFSSDGHPGMGGLDLFSAKGNKADWQQVVNLKPPFNSPKDDFGLWWESDGRSGYLSSNRDGADGTDDIYAFQPARSQSKARPAADSLAKARAAARPDTAAKAPAGSPAAPANPAGQDSKPAVGQNAPAAGNPASGKQLSAHPQSPAQPAAASQPATATQPAAVRQAVTAAKSPAAARPDEPVARRGEQVVLKNIYYDLNKADIRPDAALELNKLVDFLQQHPHLRLEIAAHTDSRHSQEYNLKLSRQRAEAVVKFLTDKGIAAGRLQAKGYGETRLLHACPPPAACPEARHQANRRTEFILLE